MGNKFNIRKYKTYSLPSGEITCLITLSDERIALSSSEHYIQILDLNNNFNIDIQIDIPKKNIQAIAQLDNGTLVVLTGIEVLFYTLSDKTFQLINTASIKYYGSKMLSLSDNKYVVYSNQNAMVFNGLSPYNEIKGLYFRSEFYNLCYMRKRNLLICVMRAYISVISVEPFQVVTRIVDRDVTITNRLMTQLDDVRIILGFQTLYTVNVVTGIVEERRKYTDREDAFFQLEPVAMLKDNNLICKFKGGYFDESEEESRKGKFIIYNYKKKKFKKIDITDEEAWDVVPLNKKYFITHKFKHITAYKYLDFVVV